MSEYNTLPPVELTPQPASNDPLQNQGCLSELGYVFSGLAMPTASLGYYRVAARRKTILAILIFFLVGTLSSVVITLSASRVLFRGLETIREDYERGELPTITIENGIARVDGPQPLVLSSDESGSFLAVDTTGQITEIDTSRYDSGFLLTRDEVHVYNRGNDYRRLPMSSINELFQADPLVINQESVSQFYSGFSVIMSVLILVFVWLWTTVIRLGYIALLALPVWGLASLIRSNTSFNTVLITGLMALIPALYMVYLLEQAQIGFVFLGTLVELVVWLVMLVLVLNMQEKALPGWAQLKPWRALMALPALGYFALHVIFQLPNGALISWVLAVVTVVAMAGIALLGGDAGAGERI